MSPFPNADQDPSCEGNPSHKPEINARRLVGVNGHPTAHGLLPMAVVGDLSRWIDGQLELLQQKHQAFITRSSLRKDLRR